ncbi:MAG: RNA methyltransferase [Verrucomicrobia bacterium]|nr:RNA methyltransferase [Verrucomicrobiota bacterium]
MQSKTIASLQHPLVKHFVELRKERAYREEKKEVAIAGEKLVRELAEKGPLSVLMTLKEEPHIAARDRYVVPEEILKKVTGLGNPDGFAATIPMPAEQPLENKKNILILDRLSDPGNLGTLFRTALALGWEGIWLTAGTVDPFNDKAIRAARGATFWLPFAWKSQEEIVSWVQSHHAALYTADLNGKPIGELASVRRPAALILSSESHGAQHWPSQKITIPMEPHVESLNVAASGAILLYALRRLP